MVDVLGDLKRGPLDHYRQKASFDWRKLKIFLDTQEVIDYQNTIYNELLKYPDYFPQDPSATLTIDQQRRLTSRQALIWKSMELLSIGFRMQNLKFPVISTKLLMQFYPSLMIKVLAAEGLFNTVIEFLGTERHVHYITNNKKGKIFGSYALTEIAHGSNVKGMQCTATFNEQNQTFCLNSGFEGAKCWAGGLGQMASHCVVNAQLVIKGVAYGVHAFVVPVRDPKSLLPYPGLLVGDMGEKIGLNGIDNGFVIFNNYEIPRENLLNKLGDVTPSGDYITPFKDPSTRLKAALGALAIGRVIITGVCQGYGIKALTIAIRYAAVRRQFGPGDEEIPILEYQSHQYRLLPYLAAAYVLHVFSTDLAEKQYQFIKDSVLGNNKDKLSELGAELHGVSSASKPVSGWTMRDAIQESRECCGGHGYLKAAGLGDIRNDHDANLTYEGENHVLIQQTSNWLLKFWPLMVEGREISTPMKSADFFTRGMDILRNSKLTARSEEEMCSPDSIMGIYQWLVCYLLKRTQQKLAHDLKQTSNFAAKNDNQVFYAKSLSIAYIQHFMLQVFLEKISETTSPELRNVLLKLFSLYALFSLEKHHMGTLYQGGLAVGPEPATLIQNSILKLISDIKDDAVALVDVLAPPDFVLNSVLGNSDGEVYKHLYSAIMRSPYNLARPDWWRDITNWQENVITSKL